MKHLTLLLLCLLTVSGYAQENKNETFSLEFYGFIRNDFYLDTYKGIDAGYEQFYLLPLFAGTDTNGKQINEQASAGLSAIATRMGVRVKGPEIFGAQTSAVIEYDFAGILRSEPTLFRIRHAYQTFQWNNRSLVVGQTWHPFWGGGVFPTVAGLNTGAPFQAFNRSPQVKYTCKRGDLTLYGAAVYELQYSARAMESGVYTSPTQAKRNGVLPELSAGTELAAGNFTLGAAASYNRIKPRMTVTGTAGIFVADEYLNSLSGTAYLKYKDEWFTITAKGYLGQNMTHLTIPGGYGVATRDAVTGRETYTNYTNYTALLNAVYGKEWQVGMMMGFGENLGTTKELYSTTDSKAITAGLLPTVQDMFRVAPHASYNISKLRLVAEYEMTSASYGVGQIDFTNGLFNSTRLATNNRFILSMTYLF